MVVVDWAVARVLDVLDELGVSRDTLLIVTSDNGAEPTYVDGKTYGHRANGEWRGQKADIWEGGHREPFVARWPGHIPAGTVTGQLFGLVDLLPTIASAVRAPVPEGAAEDGTDVFAVLTGELGESPRASIVHHSGDGVFSLRHGNWKLVMGSGSGGFSEPKGRPCDALSPEGQLYDLSVDPGETDNLWRSHASMVAQLYALLKQAARGPASGLSFDALRHEIKIDLPGGPD